MKKQLFLALFALTTGSLFAQDKIQWSQVREQNSKKRPIPDAQVVFSNAKPAASDQAGKLRLVFTDKKAGQSVSLNDLVKAGYELVNDKEVEQVKLSDTDQLGVDIILAPTGVVDAAKKSYYDISDKSLKTGFEREKTKLRQERDAARLSEQQFEEQLTQLREQYDHQKKELDALAEKFARVNFDDVTPVYREALELFKAGKINEAIAKLEGADPAKRTAQIIQEGKDIESDEKKLAARKATLAKEKQQQIQLLRLLADMYSLKFDPAKADTLYDQLLRLDSTDLEILQDAANFYRENHRYEKALRTYPMLIAHPQAEDWQIANAHGNMGEMHTATGNLTAALYAYTESFKAYEKLQRGSPANDFYQQNLAVSYSKLGSTHTSLGNLDKALKYYEERSRLGKELFEAYPNNVEFKNGLAISYEKLGSTHTSLGNLDKALKYYEDETTLFKELFEAYPNNVSFKNGLAISYAKLGVFSLEKLKDKTKARGYFQKAEKLWVELVRDAPQVAQYQRFLGQVRRDLEDLEK